ncbi:hypothetical protein NicSoilC12_07380 [Arthrobacter sp. NicSoilC12]|nr:hypothetical protein NicSoilC12_07380 [Arthrobacter sp. NicSoilC12]
MFELVRDGEDFQVLQAVPGFAEEGALELAELFLGGLGAVLVQRLGPAAGDPGQEVGVVLGRGAGQGVLHRRRGLGVAAVSDPVQGERDEGRGPGGDVAGRDGGSELRVHGRDGPAGESLPGQQRAGQAEPAPGLRGADPQPRPQELHRVPVPVIQHRFRHRRLTRSGASGGNRPNRPAGGSRGQGSAGRFRGSGCAGLPPGGALTPAGGPPGDRPRRDPRGRGCGLLPGPVHGGRRDELQILHRAGDFLHAAGEVRRGPESPRPRVLHRRRTHRPQGGQGGVHTGLPDRGCTPLRALRLVPAGGEIPDEIPDGFHGSSLFEGSDKSDGHGSASE